jgi:hypothetical protein
MLVSHAEPFGGLKISAVVADVDSVPDERELSRYARTIGASLVLSKLAADDCADQHDPKRLSEAFTQAFAVAT